MSAASSPDAKALELLNQELIQAGLKESQLLAWLKKVQAVPPGIFTLRSIPARRLEILLQEWESVREQLL